jgi:hypothetical protein
MATFIRLVDRERVQNAKFYTYGEYIPLQRDAGSVAFGNLPIFAQAKTWMAGSSPAMTADRFRRASAGQTPMPQPSPEAWAQIRHDYENTERPVAEICAEHRTTPNTLRVRARKWGWRMRQPRIPAEGPPALSPPPGKEIAELGPRRSLSSGRASRGPVGGDDNGVLGASSDIEPSPHIGVTIVPAIDDNMPIGERLQGAVARVLPAIEANLVRLSAGPVRPREMEMAARTLGSLMRTLRELNGLLAQHKAEAPRRSTEELRASLARKLEAIVAEREAQIPAKYETAWNEFAAEAGQAVTPSP